jgi:hypothetical protein
MEQGKGVCKLLNMTDEEFLSIRKKIMEFQILDEMEIKDQVKFYKNKKKEYEEFSNLRDIIEDLYNFLIMGFMVLMNYLKMNILVVNIKTMNNYFNFVK